MTRERILKKDRGMLQQSWSWQITEQLLKTGRYENSQNNWRCFNPEWQERFCSVIWPLLLSWTLQHGFFVDLHESSNILILSSTCRGAALLLSLLAEAICAIWCLIDNSINQWLHWLPTERKHKLWQTRMKSDISFNTRYFITCNSIRWISRCTQYDNHL